MALVRGFSCVFVEKKVPDAVEGIGCDNVCL